MRVRCLILFIFLCEIKIGVALLFATYPNLKRHLRESFFYFFLMKIQFKHQLPTWRMRLRAIDFRWKRRMDFPFFYVSLQV